jgi:hypothetical protein
LAVFATLNIVVIHGDYSPKPGFGTNHLLTKPEHILRRFAPVPPPLSHPSSFTR